VAELRAGGNAVDAAIAATLVAGVVNPVSSGIGGGGFALYWDAKAQRATVLDFREVAPRALDAAAFEKRPFAQGERGRAVGVPGEVAGLWELHRRFGARQWAKLVEPAITAAKDGFVPSPHLSRAVAGQMAALKQDTQLAQLFFPGAAAGPGTRLKNPMLAHVLGWLSQLGPHAIYDGPVAGDIIASAGRAGGAIAYADLQGYRVVEREPLRISWEGNDVYTMPPPSAGGLMLGQVLGMFGSGELRSWGIDSGAYVHHLAEALRGSLVDRFTTLGDPAFEPHNVAALLAPQRLSRRRAAIDANETRTLPQLLAEEHGTHHLVVVDPAGNVVSLTTTVNSPFGAKLATRSGFLLNDELDDFSRASDAALLGLARSPNRPRPLARPVSSMTPTIVVRGGKVVLALGGSGGHAHRAQRDASAARAHGVRLVPAARRRAAALCLVARGAELAGRWRQRSVAYGSAGARGNAGPARLRLQRGAAGSTGARPLSGRGGRAQIWLGVGRVAPGSAVVLGHQAKGQRARQEQQHREHQTNVGHADLRGHSVNQRAQ
jgi:gamma-glutamyltranspeptidase/glutathione hydrolase